MKLLRLILIPAVFVLCFVSCTGDEDENEGNNQGAACSSNLDCPVGYYCHPEQKVCTSQSGNGNNSDVSDSDSNHSGDDSDTGSSSDNTDTDSGNNNPPVKECSMSSPCTPGDTCGCDYQADPATENVGPCRRGISTCKEDGTWGKCVGEVLPVNEIGAELCGNGIDDDCNGVVDDGTDFDGDGFGACSDCCETASSCNGFDPATIYPGAYEMIGDEVDNNCNGEVDEATSCDGTDEPLAVGDYAGNAIKLAHAMGICGDQLVSAEISLAGDPVTEYIADNSCGSGLFGSTYNKSDRTSRSMPYYENDYKTFAAEPKFGNNITPMEGSKIAILSTGPWNKPTKDAECATLEAGDMKTASKIPSDWINMMPNCAIPKSPSCGGTTVTEELSNQCENKTIPSVQDPIMLTLKVKAPMNARAFQFNLFFFSVEYPNTVCNDNNYNDFFIALLDSEHNTTYPDDEFQNPYDKNLAKDDKGNPVGVDLAPNGLFMVCGSNGSYASNCTQGTTLLEGTGFDSFSSGGTGWLTTRGNVVPGETITLRLALWEQGEVSYGPDHSWDSTVLLDGFKWLPKPAKAGTGQQ
ncbi:putative metal-binding motif-containing protein [bacterium]|nr:putative metal-binding motif-containing protein [bacterium]